MRSGGAEARDERVIRAQEGFSMEPWEAGWRCGRVKGAGDGGRAKVTQWEEQ